MAAASSSAVKEEGEPPDAATSATKATAVGGSLGARKRLFGEKWPVAMAAAAAALFVGSAAASTSRVTKAAVALLLSVSVAPSTPLAFAARYGHPRCVLALREAATRAAAAAYMAATNS